MPHTDGGNMNGIVIGLVVMAMLAAPVAFAGTANGLELRRDLSPVVIGPMPTDRLGGGEMIAVKAGDAVFGVRYGVDGRANDIVIFAEYKRFLGAAEIVDERGRYLATRGIPVFTVLAQSLTRFIEFQKVNETEGYDLQSVDGLASLSRNLPVKVLSLVTAWELREFTNRTVDNVTYVDFTLSARDLHYTRIMNETNLGDGIVNLVAFTFHLTIEDVVRSGQVPVFRVTVDDGDHREITHAEFLRMENVTAQAVAMGAKYDHRIEGWDFLLLGDRLVLETRLLLGNFIPDRTSDFVHALLRERAEDGNGTYERDDRTLNESLHERPRLYTLDRVYFDDDYTRIGRFTWVTSVTVDGQPMRMAFQVQGGGRLRLEHAGMYFVGFWLRGAFVYPAGQVIDHDPALYTESFVELPSGFNLTPISILAIQLGIVGVALVPAIYLRARARRAASK